MKTCVEMLTSLLLAVSLKRALPSALNTSGMLAPIFDLNSCILSTDFDAQV